MKSITITEDDEQFDAVFNIMFAGGAIESSSQEEVAQETGKPDDTSSDEISKDDLEVGQTVLVDFGDDGKVEGEITSMPPKNKKQVQVTPQDTGEPEMIDITDIIEIVDVEAEPAAEEDGEETWAKDDEVEFKKGRKDVQGVIRSVDEEAETVKVKIEGERKLEVVAFDKLILLED